MPFLKEGHLVLADELGADRDLVEGLDVHESVHVAVGKQELVVLLLQTHALDRFRRTEAFIELGAVTQFLQLDLQIGSALAGLGVLNLGGPPQAALVFDHHAGADGVSVDLHGINRQ